jgi:hypothetical protein
MSITAKQKAALSKGRAKLDLKYGRISKTKYNSIIKKANKTLKKKSVKRRNSAVRMGKTFDDPEWKTFSRKASKKNPIRSRGELVMLAIMKNAYDDRKGSAYFGVSEEKRLVKSLVKKGYAKITKSVKVGKRTDIWAKITSKGLQAYKQNPTVPMGSSTGGGYSRAMRGFKKGGTFAKKRVSRQVNKDFWPVGFSSETGRDVSQTALVAGAKLNPRKKKRKSTRGWYKFSMYAKSGKKLGVRTGLGVAREATKTGNRILGSKVKNRIVHRVVISGPLKNKPEV